MQLTEIALLDDLLSAHAEFIGADFIGYRHHAHRVANICLALSPDQGDRMEKVAVASAFHDIGIWTDRTFDYLQPSVRLANEHLARSGHSDWSAEISAMILDHHKLSPSRDARSLVEPFRRADWTDVSMGLTRFGLPQDFLRELFVAWPSAGFHKRLVQLSLRRWWSHPLSPLPMVKW